MLTTMRSEVPLSSLRDAASIAGVVVRAIDLAEASDGTLEPLQGSEIDLSHRGYAITRAFGIAEATLTVEETGSPSELFSIGDEGQDSERSTGD
jgi:hypothetical protein